LAAEAVERVRTALQVRSAVENLGFIDFSGKGDLAWRIHRAIPGI